MAAIAFLVFYNNYMIAPLVPVLARGFGVHPDDLQWLVPGFSMLYGVATLVYGVMSDRFGRYPVLRVLLGFAAATTLALWFAMSARQLLLLRLLSAAGTGGIATIALSIVGDHYPFAVPGRPMGRMFGAIVAGMGLGSSLGPLLNPLLGWRNELRILALAFAVLSYWITRRYNNKLRLPATDGSLWEYAREYFLILDAPRGGRTLAFIFFNGAFHGGIVAWLAVFLTNRYRLSESRNWACSFRRLRGAALAHRRSQRFLGRSVRATVCGSHGLLYSVYQRNSPGIAQYAFDLGPDHLCVVGRI
jgi:MFS family permease